MAQGPCVIGEWGSLLGVFKGVDLNSANTDHELKIGWPKYVVEKVIVTDASTSLAISGATLGIFTASGGGGTAVVSAATLTALTGATKIVLSTLALTTDYLTSGSLFARTVLAHGSAATCNVYVFGRYLP